MALGGDSSPGTTPGTDSSSFSSYYSCIPIWEQEEHPNPLQGLSAEEAFAAGLLCPSVSQVGVKIARLRYKQSPSHPLPILSSRLHCCLSSACLPGGMNSGFKTSNSNCIRHFKN